MNLHRPPWNSLLTNDLEWTKMLRPTVLFYTYRPGGIDILADGLKNQTHQNYELVIVDDYVERKQKVKRYLARHDIHPEYLGPSKKKGFPNIKYNCTNSLNTGILMSTGDPIIVLTDYIWMPPKAIERFCSFESKYKKNWCITTAGRMWEKTPKDLSNPISVFRPYWKGTPEQNKCRYDYNWVPEKWEMSFSAIPYRVYKKTNGCPECWDCLTSLIDDINEKKIQGLITPQQAEQQIQKRLQDAFYFHEKVGAHYYIDKQNICEMINHRDWLPEETWHATKMKPTGTETKFIRRKNRFDLKTHKRGTL